jgi:hypothetical protein
MVPKKTRISKETKNLTAQAGFVDHDIAGTDRNKIAIPCKICSDEEDEE